MSELGPWEAYGRITRARDEVLAPFGLVPGGELSVLLRHALDSAGEKLAAHHGNGAEGFLLEPHTLVLQLERALQQTAVAFEHLCGLRRVAVVGWSQHSVAYEAVDEEHGRCVVEVARPEAAPDGERRWVIDHDTARPMEVPPPVLMTWGAKLHRQLSGTSPIFPRFYRSGVAGDVVYTVQEYLEGRTLRTALLEGAPADRDAGLGYLAAELLLLEQRGLLVYHHGIDPGRIFIDGGRFRLLPPAPRGVSNGRAFRVVTLSSAPEGRGNDRFALEACGLRSLRGDPGIAFGREPERPEPRIWTLDGMVDAVIFASLDGLPFKHLGGTRLGEGKRARCLLNTLGLDLTEDGWVERRTLVAPLSGWWGRGVFWTPLHLFSAYCMSRNPHWPQGGSDSELVDTIRQQPSAEVIVEAIQRLRVDVFRGELLTALVAIPYAVLASHGDLAPAILVLLRQALAVHEARAAASGRLSDANLMSFAATAEHLDDELAQRTVDMENPEAPETPRETVVENRWVLGPEFGLNARWGHDLLRSERVIVVETYDHHEHHLTDFDEIITRHRTMSDDDRFCAVLAAGQMARNGGRGQVFRSLVLRAPGETTLRAKLRDGPLTVSLAANTGVWLCRTLQALHERGIFHGNLHLGQVLVSRYSDELALLGMGTASLMIPSDAEMHWPVAPCDHLYPDWKVADSFTEDIWSLGCMLYEMVSGRAPFVPRPDTYLDALSGIRLGLTQEVIPLRTFSGVGEDFADVVHRCFLQKPKGWLRKGRYQRVTELGAALLPFTSQPQGAEA